MGYRYVECSLSLQAFADHSLVNVAVATQPLDILPHFFKYGYAMPFYNISAAVRTILFGTKNQCEYVVSL